MATLESNGKFFRKTLSEDEVTQRVIRLESRARLFPGPGILFDLWLDDLPWASRIRSEPCTCPRPGGTHRHRYLEGGELHAGLRWKVGAELCFERLEDGRIQVSGDIDP
ncbi:MAG: hypothetical protein VX498_04070 [Myxococcota bacterium]|nr:hypothetical protein [Myxococcota bacterium]